MACRHAERFGRRLEVSPSASWAADGVLWVIAVTATFADDRRESNDADRISAVSAN